MGIGIFRLFKVISLLCGFWLTFGLSSSVQAQTAPSLSPYQGQWVYLDFWASWCAPCKASFPFMNDLQRQLQNQNFTVVAVNLDEDLSAAKQFLEQTTAGFPVLYDPEGRLPTQFSVQAMPTSFLLNPQGKIVWQHQGFLPKDAAKIQHIIQQKMQGA
ncbi:MAG: TlpA family protein disulfide reductase [Thiotrichales bacterium]|nr:TlpA family protein disulfide reductase [Thiotrichales bacterium]